jgi:hypothetical protein
MTAVRSAVRPTTNHTSSSLDGQPMCNAPQGRQPSPVGAHISGRGTVRDLTLTRSLEELSSVTSN